MLRIDQAHLMADLEALARIGADPAGGVTRLGYTTAESEAMAWAETTLTGLGLQTRRDAAGNLIATLPGESDGLPPLACGSHLDTVIQGGRYDGALGVAAAVACARTLVQSDRYLRHDLEVIVFRCEEAVYGGGTLGSRAMAGLWDDAYLAADAGGGRTLADLLREQGIDPARCRTAARAPGALTAFLELHIEQGGILEAHGEQLGAVAGIVGIRRYAASFVGLANHAGTTPMGDLRRDALVAASKFVLAVEAAATAAGHGAVGTVGVLKVSPGAGNVIPGQVDLSFELRCLDEGVLDRLEAAVSEQARTLGGAVRPLSVKPHVDCDPHLVRALRNSAGALGLKSRELASGAGHDAMCMAQICPVAMAFVPSQGGISHNPAEYTAPADCAAGADVLLDALQTLDSLMF